MAHKRIRNNRFHYTITNKLLPNGRVYLTFDDEEEGDQYTQKLDALLATGKVPTEFLSKPGAIITIADAIDQYLIKVHVPESDHLLLAISRKRLGSTLISKVNHDWADKWIEWMKEQDLSPSTIRHHVGALARCFDWIKRAGNTLMLSNPLRELPKRYASGHKEEVQRDRRLEPHEELEVRRIVMGGKPKDKERGFKFDNPDEMMLLFDIAIESGMRLSEIHTLEKSQIGLNDLTIYLDKTKNGDNRQVPMTSILHSVLTEYLRKYTDNKIFSFTGTRKQVSDRLSQTWGRIFEAAGCGEFTFHGLRHEATSRLYERTKLTDLEIAKILGWRSLRMALRYTNLRASKLAEKLW